MVETDSFPPEFLDRVAAATHKALSEIVSAMGVRPELFELSRDKILEVGHSFLKDLRRLAIPQDSEIADTKYAAYWAFWVRKLKPIRVAWTDETKTKEITDINERAALELAIVTVKKAGRHPSCIVRGACAVAECDGSICVELYTNEYLTVNKNQYSEYLVYSMGRRTFGPHHLATVLDAVLFAACRQPGGKPRPDFISGP